MPCNIIFGTDKVHISYLITEFMDIDAAETIKEKYSW